MRNKQRTVLGRLDPISQEASLTKSFREIEKWLKDEGISTKHTRFEKYKTFVFDGVEGVDSLEASTMFRETHELIWTFDAYKNFKDAHVLDLVKKSIKGCIDQKGRPDQQQSRSFLFELRVAAYLLQAGFEVNFSTDCDIVAKTGKRIYYLECKRLYSDKKILVNLKKASKQLTKRMDGHEGRERVSGIICIDPGYLIAKDIGIYTAYFQISAQHAVRQDIQLFNSLLPLDEIKLDSRIPFILTQTCLPMQFIPPPYLSTSFTSVLYQVTKSTWRYALESRRFHKAFFEVGASS